MQGMRKTEVPHHSHEQIVAYFNEALDIANEVGVGDDLRPIVFGKAVDLLSAKQLFFEQVSPLGALAIPRNHQ